MPYITSIERRGIQKGLEQGLIEGLEQGLTEGLEQGLIEGIELALELKFGDAGLTLIPEISQIKNIEKLRAIKLGLKTVQTIEELRAMYQPQ
ncbi:hypothetical protein NIES4074_40700 [Cylindrospermum sp. NIES-4074]|nr:hypothetical protein NIES4074_40700 [Cylindrospermum sp. NIES-4074]